MTGYFILPLVGINIYAIKALVSIAFFTYVLKLSSLLSDVYAYYTLRRIFIITKWSSLTHRANPFIIVPD